MFKETFPPTETIEKAIDLEQWLSSEFQTQYETKAKILNQTGLLEILPESQDIGILGIDGKEYPFPEPETIEQELRKHREFYETKMAQGFTELEIVPFAMPISRLIETLKKELVKHNKEGKLFCTKKNQDDPNEDLVAFELNEDDPIHVWEKYIYADETGELIYDIKEFSENHGGKTKQEMINELNDSTMPGYLITLREKSMNIPREGHGEIKGGRKQIEAFKTSKEYLKMLQTDEQYQGESGQTPEEWLTEFIAHLKETDQVIDDWKGFGRASFQLGAYFPASSDIPVCRSNRGGRQASLGRRDPHDSSGFHGARSSVRVRLEV